MESYFHRPIVYLIYIFHRHMVSLVWIRMKMKRELLTRMSSLPPNLYVTSRTKRSRWFLTETSQTDPVTRHPLACQSLRRSLSSASSKVHVCTAFPAPPASPPPPACTRHMTPVEITIAGTSLWLRDEGV